MTSSLRANALSPADINLSGAICVKTVDGGKTTNPLWVSEVDNASFLIALEASLKNNGLLAETPETCRYDVEVNLLGPLLSKALKRYISSGKIDKFALPKKP